MMNDGDPAPATDDGPRLHHHALAARHVLVAPRRAERPAEADLAAVGGDPRAWCPFCAGNESRTPPEVLRAPPEPGRPWRSRIVPNAFPFVGLDGGMAAPRTAADRPAGGVHDVVVEAAAHERSILAVDAADWRDVWELCRLRLAALAVRDDLAWATVFKNSGPLAGASLAHVHSQLVALDFVPPLMAAELAAAARHEDPFGELLAAAAAAGRIVREADGIVAVVPPAPRQPFETWLVPVGREPFFHAARAAQVAAVADLTRWFVERLERLVPGADYNWWLHQAPHHASAGTTAWHWHLEIVPRLAQLAGFELGTGCHVSTLAPAEAARRLREG